MDKKAKTGTVTPQKRAHFGNSGTKTGTRFSESWPPIRGSAKQVGAIVG
jgi:hypothetical protein